MLATKLLCRPSWPWKAVCQARDTELLLDSFNIGRYDHCHRHCIIFEPNQNSIWDICIHNILLFDIGLLLMSKSKKQ